MTTKFAKRHYEFVAQVLRDNAPLNTHYLEQHKLLASRFAEQFGNDNPNFKRAQFMKACGFSE